MPPRKEKTEKATSEDGRELVAHRLPHHVLTLLRERFDSRLSEYEAPSSIKQMYADQSD